MVMVKSCKKLDKNWRNFENPSQMYIYIYNVHLYVYVLVYVYVYVCVCICVYLLLNSLKTNNPIK